MTRLVLVKHSLPQIARNVASHEWRLSAEGQRRCDWLAHALQRHAPSKLFSSFEPKARETAERVAAVLGIEADAVHELRENDRTGFPFIDDPGEWERRFQTFFAEPAAAIIGLETANQARDRFEGAVTRVVDDHPNQSLGIVAHGTVISLFTAKYNDVDPFAVWKALNPLPAYLTLATPGYTLTDGPTGFDEQKSRAQPA